MRKKATAPKRPRFVFQFRIELLWIDPPIWRRIQVPEDITLDELSDVINAAMGWHGGHLHSFLIAGLEFGSADDQDLLDASIENETDVLLRGLVEHQGEKFRYQYDFGDDWQDDVLIEKVFPAEEGIKYPRCIKGRRACPPEDCGGVPGYLDLLEVAANPSHPEHAHRQS